jgi:hypothetical protein
MNGNPTITTAVNNIPGVCLLAATSPEFGAAISLGQNAGPEALKPYAVLLKNDTDRELWGYSIIWNLLDEQGTKGAMKASLYDLSTFAPGSGIPPHTARVVPVLVALGMSPYLLEKDPAATNRITNVEARFQQQAAGFQTYT